MVINYSTIAAISSDGWGGKIAPDYYFTRCLKLTVLQKKMNKYQIYIKFHNAILVLL